MSLVSSMRLRSCGEQIAYETVSGIIDPSCVDALLPRADDSTINSVQLTRRAISHDEKTIILATILGGLGCIALVIVIFLLARYCTFRQPAGDAGDLPLDEPTPTRTRERDVTTNGPQRHPQQKPPVPPPPDRPFPRPRGAQAPVHTHIPGHPYALTYARRDSLPLLQPDASAVEPASVAPRPEPTPQVPLLPPPPTLSPLVVPRLAHPYSQQQSAGLTSANYESFMLPESPRPVTDSSMVMTSPLPSSVGLQYPPSVFDSGGLSSDENPVSPSVFSHTSSTGLLRDSSKRQRTRQ